MSNVKQLFISGEMPFNTYDNPELNRFLGQLNAPSFGIRITWGKSRMVNNEYNSQTAMYKFSINGQEAVSWSWVNMLVKVIQEHGGKLDNSHVNDVEAVGDVLHLKRRVEVF